MSYKTKSQKFVDSLSKKLLNIGAIEFAAKIDSYRSFNLNTIVGNLEINIDKDCQHCYTIFCRFEDIEKAREKFNCNPYSGKYNTHVGNENGMTPEKASEICFDSIEMTQEKVL